MDSLLRLSGPWQVRAALVTLSVLRFAFIATILWLAAGMVWKLLTPVPEVSAPMRSASAEAVVPVIVAAHLFGGTSASAGTVAGGSETARVVVRGILAGQGASKALAIISINGQANSLAREGEEISPGLKLDRIYSDRIELVSASGRQVVTLTK